MESKETIVFFGTGPVAAKSLVLLSEEFEIEAVITKPRAEHHRGDVPVLEAAESLNLKVLTAINRQSLDRLFERRPVKSSLGVLVDFGIIVSRQVIDYFPLGIVNSHFSILPQWRGADPITFAILSGQAYTGVSLMLLVEKMDEGPLLSQGELPITPESTTPTLTNELIELSDSMLKNILPMYLHGNIKPVPQTSLSLVQPSYSRKISKEDGLIDWNKPAEQLEREIRAFCEWPKSRTTFAGLEVIITKSHVDNKEVNRKPGTLVYADKMLRVATNTGWLVIDQIKPAGKAAMSAAAFVAGYGKRLNLN